MSTTPPEDRIELQKYVLGGVETALAGNQKPEHRILSLKIKSTIEYSLKSESNT